MYDTYLFRICHNEESAQNYPRLVPQIANEKRNEFCKHSLFDLTRRASRARTERYNNLRFNRLSVYSYQRSKHIFAGGGVRLLPVMPKSRFSSTSMNLTTTRNASGLQSLILSGNCLSEPKEKFLEVSRSSAAGSVGGQALYGNLSGERIQGGYITTHEQIYLHLSHAKEACTMRIRKEVDACINPRGLMPSKPTLLSLFKSHIPARPNFRSLTTREMLSQNLWPRYTSFSPPAEATSHFSAVGVPLWRIIQPKVYSVSHDRKVLCMNKLVNTAYSHALRHLWIFLAEHEAKPVHFATFYRVLHVAKMSEKGSVGRLSSMCNSTLLLPVFPLLPLSSLPLQHNRQR